MQPDFEKSGGLVPAIAQDADTGQVLMMAWIWVATEEPGAVTGVASDVVVEDLAAEGVGVPLEQAANRTDPTAVATATAARRRRLRGVRGGREGIWSRSTPHGNSGHETERVYRLT